MPRRCSGGWWPGEPVGSRGGLACDAEAAGGGEQWNGGNVVVADMVCDGRFHGDFADEGVELVGLAHDLEFDAAVGQVFHPAADVESAGQVVDGVAEPDALDAALEDDAFGDQRPLGLAGAPSLKGLVSKAEDLIPKTCSMVLPGSRL